MEYNNIPKEKFRFADPGRKMADKKFDTKPISYAKDVFIRFCKNKSSVVAAIIIVILVLFAIIVPIFCETNYSRALTDNVYLKYKQLLPKNQLFADMGINFWDGGKNESMNQNKYYKLMAIQAETGEIVITDVFKAAYDGGIPGSTTKYYDVRVDSYTSIGMDYFDLTLEQFQAIQEWQNQTGIQVIYPYADKTVLSANAQKFFTANIWYKIDDRGNPVVDANGNFTPIYATTSSPYFSGNLYTNPETYTYDSQRIEGDDGSYIYAMVSENSGKISYRVRANLYTYFQYHFRGDKPYENEPAFLFGTTEKGQDLFTRLAAGARFSLVLAICISAINLFIGAIYGAIEGFYGGIADLVMERISDILAGMPSMVVMTLFQLHLASKVGPVWSMVFAFILTGWIGMASRTRMQFYRFKHQEYVLSARTLGASDSRLMFKHIFPNAMGTLITGSVLSIPGVIFSESSLTYLGIVNLSSSTQTSVGTLLSNGQGTYIDFPHIIFFPALFIALLEISFNLFGNGLRDAFNPSLKGIED